MNPRRGAWLLAGLAAVVATLGCAWFWLGVDSTQTGSSSEVSSVLVIPTPFVEPDLASAQPEEPALLTEASDIEAEGRGRVMSAQATPASKPRTGGMIRGQVLGGWNGDTPLANATVTMWRSRARNPREHEARTDAAGYFVIEDVAFAYWFAEMYAPGHRAVRLVVPVTPEEPTAAPVVRLPFWRDVGVNLVDSSGPVTNVEQIGLRPAFGRALTLGIGPRDARARSELKRWQQLGSFRGPEKLGANESTAWRLKAFTQHGECLHVLLGPRVVASHPLEDVANTIEIPVDPQAIRDAWTRASVRVVSGSGAPIAGARVEFWFEGLLVEDVTADANGLAVVRDVPHVTLTARARSPRHQPDTALVDGDETTPVIRLADGYCISGRVELPARATSTLGLDGARLELVESIALWRIDPEAERLGSRIQKLELRDGRFQFDAVRPGAYAISCGGDSVKNLRRDQVVSSPPSHVVVIHVTDHELLDVDVPWFEAVQAREAAQRKQFTGRKEGGG